MHLAGSDFENPKSFFLVQNHTSSSFFLFYMNYRTTDALQVTHGKRDRKQPADLIFLPLTSPMGDSTSGILEGYCFVGF